MLYLVEGLNCAGKTTWIKNRSKDIMIFVNDMNTRYLNPKNWADELKKAIIDEDEFLYGAYYALAYSIIPDYTFGPVHTFWDRTWISAMIYGSISQDTFLRLSNLYLTKSVTIIFIDTPVSVCIDRFKKTNDDRYDKYMLNTIEEDWANVRNNFITTMKYLSGIGYSVETLEGIENGNIKE
jgi:thymidylate kinase